MWTTVYRILVLIICTVSASILCLNNYVLLDEIRNTNNESNKQIYEENINVNVINSGITKVREMRVTGYLPTNNKTALGEKVITGKTAAVSRNCIDLLGEKVYIQGIGIRYINDLTAEWLDDKYGICTLDIAVPNKSSANKIGHKTRTVVHID